MNKIVVLSWVSKDPVTKLYTCNVISWLSCLGSFHVKGVQIKVMRESSHLYPARTNCIGYPSDASSWTALIQFQYVVFQIDTVVAHVSVGGGDDFL